MDFEGPATQYEYLQQLKTVCRWINTKMDRILTYSAEEARMRTEDRVMGDCQYNLNI